MSRIHVARWVAYAATLLIGGCGALPTIGANVCGNGVLEDGEACDGPQPEGQGCAADCRAFVCGPASICPSGRGCGLDGTCYAAKGSLAPPNATLRGAADHFASVQLTSGGPRSVVAQTGDVLGRGRPRFVTFDAAGAVALDTTLPTSIGALSSADLELNGTEELFGPIPGGTVVLDAVGDGTLSPRSYATFSALPGTTRVAPVHRPGETYDDGLLLSTESPPDGSTQIVAFAQNPDLGTPVLRFPGAADRLLRTARLPQPSAEDATGCSPLVLALQEQLEVLRLDPCVRGPNGVQMFQSDERSGIPPLRAARLVGSPSPIVGGPFVLFVDADDYPDVVVVVSVPVVNNDPIRGYALAVAFGGSDGFGTRPPGPSRVLGAAERVSFVTRSPSRLEKPLDLAQFPRGPSAAEALPADSPWKLAGAEDRGLLIAFERGAGIARWAEPTEGTGSGAIVLTPGHARLSPWTSVALGSVNGDDLPDVVGGSGTESDLDVLISSGGPLFSVGTVATNTSTDKLTIADFDGDLVNDIAFASSGVDARGETNATLSVVYGRALALPDPVVVVGRYPRATIAQVAGSQFGFQDASVDFSAELSVVLRPAGASKETVSVLRGDGNRLPLAPLPLTAPMGISADTLATVAVRAGGANGASRFVMIGDAKENGVDIWQADGAGLTAVRGEPLTGCVTPQSLTNDPRSLRRADAVALDLDGDGVDEIAVAAECEGGPQLFLLAEQSGRVRARDEKRPILHPDGKRAGQITLSTGDVDGDGIPDVVAQIEGQGGERRADTRTLVFWGTSGTLEATPLDLRAGGGAVVATTFLRLATGAPPRFVAAGRDALYVSRGAADARAVTFELLPLPDGGVAESPDDDLRALFGGDVTGDSVDDLVVANAAGWQLFPGRSAR